MARKKKAQTQPDVVVTNHGSLMLFHPQNDSAREWLVENTDGQWIGGGAVARLAVEPRYAQALIDGLQDNGFSVKV